MASLERADAAATAGGSAVPVLVVLPRELLASSPSLEDGVSPAVERAHRFFGCELIQEAGVLLRLPQVAMATAQTLLHRFYYRKSLRAFDAFRVAIGCLFLAAKVEERPRRIRDVLSVFYAMFRRRKWRETRARRQLLDLEGTTFCRWREWLVMVERQVLIDVGFSVYNVTEHPHKYVLYYVKVLDGSKELAQRAWGYINDSLRIDLCVRFRAEEIACAAIFLASRALEVSLPADPAWHSLFDVSRKQLLRVSVAIMELYSLERVEWIDPLTEVDPFAVDEHPVDSCDEDEEQQQQPASEQPAQGIEEEEKWSKPKRQQRGSSLPTQGTIQSNRVCQISSPMESKPKSKSGPEPEPEQDRWTAREAARPQPTFSQSQSQSQSQSLLESSRPTQ